MAARAGRLLVVGLSVVLVTACSGEGASSGSAGSVADRGPVSAADAAGVVGDPGGGGSTGSTPGVATAGVATAGDAAAQDGRLVVSTATLGVAVDDLDAAAAAVPDLTSRAGGLVTASSRGTGDPDSTDPDSTGSGSTGSEGTARFTLRVPGDALPAVLDGVAALGRTTTRSTTATDVTAEVADVGSRVTSAQAVLATFRGRLPQATSIPDVLALEGEIATRQADLEALQARQRVLADQVALATVEVTLTRGAATVAADAPGGFTGGITTGWHALGAFAGAVAVVLGVVLPFAVPAALLAGAFVLVRRRVAARPRG